MKGDCPAWVSWLVLIIGIIYLLQDLGFGMSWWTVQWYTVVFVLLGLSAVSGNSSGMGGRKK